MKPYLIVTGDFVTSGGMDRANYALASYLAEEGFETHLVAYRVDPELASRAKIVVHRVPKPLGSYAISGPLLSCVGRYWASRITARGGRVIVNGGNCNWGDINWVHYVHAAHVKERRTHFLYSFEDRLRYSWSVCSERKILPAARVVVANSDRTTRAVIQHLGIPEPGVRTIYYGTDPRLFRPASAQERCAARAAIGCSDGRPTVAFVGALGDRRKGLDTLLAAWTRLCANPGWDADLLVVGAGRDLPEWRQRAVSSGLGSRIRFLGFRSDVPEILRACDALVSPARYEAYGLNVHEALCCGIPAIVSADAGVAERYPPQLHDLLIPDPDRADDLAARLKRWYISRDYYRAAVAPFSAELRWRTWNDMAADFVELVKAAE